MGDETKCTIPPGHRPKTCNSMQRKSEIYQPDSIELETLYAPVSKAIALTREKLDAEIALIGFSGAPRDIADLHG